MIRRLFASRVAALPAVPDRRRVYAIGDVHGRLDLFDELLARIETDNAARSEAEISLVLLGDLIDRGPDSAGVVTRAMEPVPWAATIALKGNHEAAMLAALDGDRDMMRLWLRNGGVAALCSWGVDQRLIDDATLEEVTEAARSAVPAAQYAFIARMRQSVDIGDYHFVHAGVRPGVSLDKQSANDQLWIREEFLNSRANHGAVIVHGHSVTEEMEERPNRIGIDTGAYRSGRLTALGLEGTTRWSLQTNGD